ncbi:MAG: hypothetical protein KGI38_07775 [Thaumarchaeota archaeon]|nr:hypothetical protein [Nitrososphaerota archaeon]
MSSEPVKDKAKQTLKSVKQMLEKAEDSTRKALDKAAPTVQKSFDASMETASKAFEKTMRSFEGATAGDQVKLFKAYRKFLGGQVDFVESRIKSLEEKAQTKSQSK